MQMPLNHAENHAITWIFNKLMTMKDEKNGMKRVPFSDDNVIDTLGIFDVSLFYSRTVSSCWDDNILKSKTGTLNSFWIIHVNLKFSTQRFMLPTSAQTFQAKVFKVRIRSQRKIEKIKKNLLIHARPTLWLACLSDA